MREAQALEVVDTARSARLATVTREGRVDLVPIVFALLEPQKSDRWNFGRLVSAVDHKRKSTTELKRLENIRALPEVSLIVDHYDDADWQALWWVRLRGQARVLEDGAEHEVALDTLVAKYPQYQDKRPDASVIVVDLSSVEGWAAAD